MLKTEKYLSDLKTEVMTRNDMYRNFRPFTRTADYPQRSIFVTRGKKVQQITRTGRLPAPQNKTMLLCYRDKHSRTWSDEYSVLLFTKQKIDRIFW